MMYKLMTAIAVVFFFFIVWVIYLANTGGSSIFFKFIASIPYGDKLGHMGLFGFLCFVAILGSRFRAFSLGKCKLYYGAVVVSLFVIGEEASQAFIPSRTFDFADLGADFAGILLAVLCCFCINKYALHNIENKL